MRKEKQSTKFMEGRFNVYNEQIISILDPEKCYVWNYQLVKFHMDQEN